MDTLCVVIERINARILLRNVFLCLGADFGNAVAYLAAVGADALANIFVRVVYAIAVYNRNAARAQNHRVIFFCIERRKNILAILAVLAEISAQPADKHGFDVIVVAAEQPQLIYPPESGIKFVHQTAA